MLKQILRKNSHYPLTRGTARRAVHKLAADPIKGRRIVDSLVTRRAQIGKTQQQIADAMGCSQSRISKMEAAPDGELELGALIAYARSVGLDVKISFVRQ